MRHKMVEIVLRSGINGVHKAHEDIPEVRALRSFRKCSSGFSGLISMTDSRRRSLGGCRSVVESFIPSPA